MTTDKTKPTDFHQLQESRLDTIRSVQHTHSQHNVYKHHTDGKQAQLTIGQDAW